MKKRVFALCLAAVMVLCVFCGCSTLQDRKQITVIADSLNTWLMEVEQGTTIYSYAVTDMDQNGNLEIIASMNYGTGSVTESRYLEISEDGETLQECEHVFEGDSQADIMSESADCYEDPETGEIYYVFTDTSGNGFREVYNTKVAVCLFEGKVSEYKIATESSIYEGDNEEPTVTYTDSNGNEITEEQYKQSADDYFEGFEKKSATFGWKGYTYMNHAQIAADGEPKLTEMLLDSFSKFTLNKQ